MTFNDFRPLKPSPAQNLEFSLRQNSTSGLGQGLETDLEIQDIAKIPLQRNDLCIGSSPRCGKNPSS